MDDVETRAATTSTSIATGARIVGIEIITSINIVVSEREHVCLQFLELDRAAGNGSRGRLITTATSRIIRNSRIISAIAVRVLDALDRSGLRAFRSVQRGADADTAARIISGIIRIITSIR